MKIKYPSILGVFAAILMVASFVVPAHLATPSAASADPGIMKWDTLRVPGSIFGVYDITNYVHPGVLDGRGSSAQAMAVGNDGATLAWVVRGSLGALSDALYRLTISGFIYSNTAGIFAIPSKSSAQTNTTGFGYPWGAAYGYPNNLPVNVYQIAIAPDDPKFIAVTADPVGVNGVTPVGLGEGPRRIWVTSDGGNNWDLAFNGNVISASSAGSADQKLAVTEFIRDIAVSIDYGGKRDIAFCSQDTGGLAGHWWCRASSGFNNWRLQANPPTTTTIEFYTLKFSPTYNGDASVVLVFADVAAHAAGVGTFVNVALRDLNQNITTGWVYAGVKGIEVVNPANLNQGKSPIAGELNNACLQLPSDFSGQSSSLRRMYISLDCYGATAGTNKFDGIFRVDDTTVYMLMDTSALTNKAIYSIAYFGTYASGKLLAGERLGYNCTATVPTWFTDSPTTCPIPCWYPALKPTTGAAYGVCAIGAQNAVGAAIVGWNADGSLGYVTTSQNAAGLYNQSLVYVPVDIGAPGADVPTAAARTADGIAASPVVGWWGWMIMNPTPNDEGAFAISRNNGETWNQLSLINTTIDWFNDVAVAPDCTTIYLASVNRNSGSGCNEFDSVWRATINPNVAAPLPIIPPLGTYWERVYCRTTSYNCTISQTDLPILRLVPSCTDKKDGEIVGWAAQHAAVTAPGATTGGVMAWSPDFGDYWATMTPRYRVQDFAFESSTVIYVVSPTALVQRLPYTGTAWSTNLPSYDTTLLTAHTIVAVPDGKVLVGAAANTSSFHQISFSADKGVTFASSLDSIVGNGDEHVIFDVDYKNNQFVYMGDDSPGVTGSWGTAVGTVYRNTEPSPGRWVDNDMMSAANGASGITWPEEIAGPPHVVGVFGLAQAWTGSPAPAIYAAHDNITTSVSATTYNGAVCRTISPRDGIPKPGIGWDCLDIFAPLNTVGVLFTLEPTSLKYCGCCTLDTNTTLYAIDDQSGNWSYDDSSVRTNYQPLFAGQFWTGAGLSGRFRMPEASLSDATAPMAPGPGYDPNLKKGMLWAYTDCLAKKGPALKSPAEEALIGADPVTGRNQQVDLAWEQLCLATEYELQVAKDPDFRLKINPSVNYGTGGHGVIDSVMDSIILTMDAYNMTSPAAWLAPGTLPEAGAIYWWRVCVHKSATGQLAWSDWSETRSFVVKAGFIVSTPYYGVQLLSPNNGCIGCKVSPASFSWSPWKEATKYQFDLSKDPEFKQLVVTATTTTTGYEYSGTLEYSTNYFWRVKALEVNGQNIPSDWSATFSFQTEPQPAPPTHSPAEPATPLWVWVIIAIGAILVIVTLILIFKTRRV